MLTHQQTPIGWYNHSLLNKQTGDGEEKRPWGAKKQRRLDILKRKNGGGQTSQNTFIWCCVSD